MKERARGRQDKNPGTSPGSSDTALAHCLAALRRMQALTEALADWHKRMKRAHGNVRPEAFEAQAHLGGPAGAGQPLAAWRLLPPVALSSLSPTQAMRYASPEVAARSGTPDKRADLYSLGVIFYAELVGVLPFRTDDLLELVHHHLAQPPVPPEQMRVGLPFQLSALVLKLLAKSPDARYASAEGLLADLQECQRQLEANGQINAFELGRSDMRSQFVFPSRLYGREQALADLGRYFQRAVAGEIVLFTVGGYSGVGKSALVRALRGEIEQAGGRLVEGKFDQYQRDQPYSALIEALRALLHQVLASRSELIEAWRNKLRLSLGENAALIVEVIADLELLIGRPPPAPALSGQAAQRRFNAVFADLLRCFAAAESPLVLFLDDLQWADNASLALIQAFVMQGAGANLLMVGAYRDNEVDAAHPLAQMLVELRRAQACMAEYALQPLQREHVSEFIADTCANIRNPEQLADIVVRKTEGNPFFMRQFLKNLVERGQLFFSPKHKGWLWRPELAANSHLAENVIDLMSQRLHRFPSRSQEALQVAASIGKQFELGLLARVLVVPDFEALEALAPVVHGELLQGLNPLDGHQGRQFRFVHDRVQQAAYQLGSPQNQEALHLSIGRVMLAQARQVQPHAAIGFETVDQFNKGLRLLLEPDERRSVALLNLEAGQKAMSSMAYAAAASYFAAGILLLPPQAWQQDYELSRELHMHALEAASMLSDDAGFQAKANTLLRELHLGLDRIALSVRRCIHLCQASRMAEGLAVGRSGLIEAGIPIPELQDREAFDQALLQQFQQFNTALAGRAPGHLIYALPSSQDPAIPQLLRLIGAMADAATIIHVPLLNLIGAVGANLSLAHGNSLSSPLMYTLLAQGLVSRVGDYGLAQQLAAASQALCEAERSDLWTYGRARVHQFWFVLHWGRHIADNMPEIESAFAATRRAHDPLYGAYMLLALAMTHFFMGRRMDEVLNAHARVEAHCRPYPMDAVVAFTQPFERVARLLKGDAEDLGAEPAAAPDMQMQAFEQRWAEFPMITCLLRSAQVVMHGLFDHHEQVLRYAADPVLKLAPPFLPLPAITFWRGVSSAALARAENDSERSPERAAQRANHLRCLQACEAELDAICRHGTPDNNEHRLLFLGGLHARLQGDSLRAQTLMRKALALAGERGFQLEQAYMLEQLALLLQEQDEQGLNAHEGEVLALLKLAATHYRGCQAHALVPRVDRALHLAGGMRVATRLESPNEELDYIDMLAVLRSVQAITRHVETDALLRNLYKIILEASGAERGAIIRRKEDELIVEVSSASELSDEALAFDFPTHLLRFVGNTGQRVLLNQSPDGRVEGGAPEAAANAVFSSFGDKAYFRERAVASVLCMPIAPRPPHRRLLYLEHSSMSEAFPKRCLSVLEWLSAQAHISLEHAELYANLEAQVSERTLAIRRHSEALDRLNVELAQASQESALRATALVELKEQMRLHAEQRNLEKSRFIAAAVHDLKQPIQAIVSTLRPVEIAFERGDQAAARELLDLTRRAARLLQNQLSAVLDLSKLESGSVRPKLLGIKLQAVVEQVLEQARSEAQASGVRLEWHSPPHSPALRVRSDAHFLSRVIANLVSNGIKYHDISKPEQPWLALKIELREPDHALLSVEDNGIGIAQDLIDNDAIFQPFFQANNRAAKGEKGVGLGLAIVRGLIALLPDHELHLRSRAGVGTRFSLRLPLATLADGNDEYTFEEAGSAAEVLRAQLDGLYILLVEDDDMVRLSTTRMLESAGVCCEAFASCEEFAQALPKLERQPDLVLTDYLLPGGQTAAQVMHAIHQHLQSTPVVVITGETLPDVPPAELAGLAILNKPVSAETLLHTLVANIPPRSQIGDLH